MNDLFGDVRDFIRRYIVIADDELSVVTAWVFHAWQFLPHCTRPYVTPYLYIYSAQKGSGKTLLGLDLFDVLVPNPMPVSNITAAALFRVIEDLGPTLLIDEVDTIWAGARNDDLRSVINTGYRNGAKVPRVEGGEVRMFSTFCPKVLCGIDNAHLPDTIRDRCIPIHMHRATVEERATVVPFYRHEIPDVTALQDRLYNWSGEHTQAIHSYRPAVMVGLQPRQWEICQPLLQVARILGRERVVREALARLMSTRKERTSVQQDLLLLVREAFADSDSDRITTAELLDIVRSDPRFARWSGHKLAAALAPFNVRPEVIRTGNSTARGYMVGAFADAWERYLS